MGNVQFDGGRLGLLLADKLGKLAYYGDGIMDRNNETFRLFEFGTDSSSATVPRVQLYRVRGL